MNYHLGDGLNDFNKQLPAWISSGLKVEAIILALSLFYVAAYSIYHAAGRLMGWLNVSYRKTSPTKDMAAPVFVTAFIIYLLTFSFMLASTPRNNFSLPRYYVLFLPFTYLTVGILARDVFRLLDYLQKRHKAIVLHMASTALKAGFSAIIIFSGAANFMFFLNYNSFLLNYTYPSGWFTAEPGLPYVFGEAAVKLMSNDSISRGCKTFTFSDSLRNSGKTVSTPALEYTAFKVLNLGVKGPVKAGNMHYFIFVGRPPVEVENISRMQVGPYAIFPEYAVKTNISSRCA